MATAIKRTAAVRKKHKILLVDDHPVIRRGLRQLLEQEISLEICGEAASAAETRAAIAQHKPDLVVLDLSLGDSSGVNLIKELHAQYPTMLILVASMHHEAVYAEWAMRAGAVGYLSKEALATEIVKALRHVLSGQVYLSPKMTSRFLHRMVNQTPALSGPAPMDTLSERELEVFKFIGEGLGVREIAERLTLSVKTIESYRQNIKTKLNLKNSNELVRQAVHWQLQQNEAPSPPPPAET